MNTPEGHKSLVEVLANAEHPTIYTFKNKIRAIIPEKSFVQSIKEAVRDHPELMAIGFIIATAGGACFNSVIEKQSSTPQPIPTQESNLPSQQDILTTADYIKMAEALMTQRGLNLNDYSFMEEMAEKGLIVQLEMFGPQARLAQAGEEGLKIRRVPSLEPNFDTGKRLNAGEAFTYIARVSVRDLKSQITDVYGLLTAPYMITVVEDKDMPFPAAPNVLKTTRGFVQIEPAYVRLERRLTDGSVQNFTTR